MYLEAMMREIEVGERLSSLETHSRCAISLRKEQPVPGRVLLGTARSFLLISTFSM